MLLHISSVPPQCTECKAPLGFYGLRSSSKETVDIYIRNTVCLSLITLTDGRIGFSLVTISYCFSFVIFFSLPLFGKQTAFATLEIHKSHKRFHKRCPSAILFSISLFSCLLLFPFDDAHNNKPIFFVPHIKKK